MPVTATAPPVCREPSDEGVRRRRFTREEYYRAAQLGIFRPGERLELLAGEILEKMRPQLTPRATAILDTAEELRRAFGSGCHVRQQLPLILDEQSEPEPDLMVVTGSPRDYLGRHPQASDVLLLVEVADTTLHFDQGRKLTAYAGAGIPEYWIENLKERRLEVYRDPEETGYKTVLHYDKEETIAPLAAPDATIRVADLLPPALEGQAPAAS